MLYYFDMLIMYFRLNYKSADSILIIRSTESFFQPNPPWNTPTRIVTNSRLQRVVHGLNGWSLLDNVTLRMLELHHVAQALIPVRMTLNHE